MTSQSTIETNKLLARLWVEFINTKDIEGLTAITTDNWMIHGASQSFSEDREGVRKMFTSFKNLDQLWVIEDMIAEGDKVVIRALNYCRQDNFLGIPSEGRTQVFTATFIHKIVDGRIKETWRNADDLGRVLQLGAHIVPEQQDPGYSSLSIASGQ